MQLEKKFQQDLIKEIQRRLPGAIVLKNDPNYIQGIPDLTVLYEDRWATLELKRHTRASRQPNQSWYVERMNEMSFSAIINPENKEEVLDALQRSFEASR